MKKKLLSFTFLMAGLTSFSQNNLFVSSGATLSMTGNAQLTLQNSSFTNNGSFTAGTGTVSFTGTTQQTISGSATTTFYNLAVGNSGNVLLQRNISVSNQVQMSSGLLNMQTNNIVLAATGSLTGESETSRITGGAGGYIEITVPVNAGANLNPGNIGMVINPASSMGSVTFRRGHDAQTITPAGRPSVNRYFDIIPTTNTGLNASFTFNYFDAELNARTEAQLSMWASADNTNWTAASYSTRSSASNFVQLTGINSFVKRWTLTDQQFATGVFDWMNENKGVKLWPNPAAQTNLVYLQLKLNKPINGTMMVVDVSGKTAMVQKVSLVSGANTLPINISKLSNGIYTVMLLGEDGSRSQLNFIKE